MDSLIVPVIGFLAIIVIFAAGSAINMRRRLKDAEEARRRLKAGWESKLREEEHKRRQLEQELSKIQDASKRLQEAWQGREKEEQDRHRLQTMEREHEKELRDRTEEGKLDRFTSDLSQSIDKLSQLQDELKRTIRELHEMQKERGRTEQQGRRTAQNMEQLAQTEREPQKRYEKEMLDRLGAKTKEVANKLHMNPEEQAWLDELLKQSTRDEVEHLQ